MIKFEALVDAIHDAVVKANDSLMDKNIGLLDKFFEKEENGTLKARMISLEYPLATEGGLTKTKVNVPLITLSPVSTSLIEELKFSTDLYMQVVDDKLEVSFGVSTPKNDDGSPQATTAHIDIVVKPQQTSEGLKKLIEGYERALRAQIPG